MFEPQDHRIYDSWPTISKKKPEINFSPIIFFFYHEREVLSYFLEELTNPCVSWKNPEFGYE